MRSIRLRVLLSVLVAPLCGAAAQDGGEAPPKLPTRFDRTKDEWMGLLPGSFVRFRMVNQIGAMEQEGEKTETLKEVGEKEYQLSVVESIMGTDTDRTQSLTLPAFEGASTVEVEGAARECEVWKQSLTMGEYEVVFRRDLEVSTGRMLRFRLVGEDQSIECSAEALEDKVEVGENTLSCVRLKGRGKFAQGEADVRMWVSSEIPGGLVRFEIRVPMPGQEISFVQEMVEFEARRRSPPTGTWHGYFRA